jgi:DNA-binding response OmpR family regulator
MLPNMKPTPDTDWMLIVEDQLDLWTLLEAHLKTALPALPLVHVSQPATAFGYLYQCVREKQRLPGMVLSNLYLPHLEDGLHLLTTLKEPASLFRHLPVVIMSALTQVQDRQEVNRRGGSYLPKPVSQGEWKEFVSTIQYYWYKSAAANANSV